MSEKLLIERLKTLSAGLRGPVREALLDAGVALTEAEAEIAALREQATQDRLALSAVSEYVQSLRERVADKEAMLETAQGIVTAALNTREADKKRLSAAEALLREGSRTGMTVADRANWMIDARAFLTPADQPSAT